MVGLHVVATEVEVTHEVVCPAAQLVPVVVAVKQVVPGDLHIVVLVGGIEVDVEVIGRV